MVSITNDSLLKGETNKRDEQVKLSVRLIGRINRTHQYLWVQTTCLGSWRQIQPTCQAHAGNTHSSNVSTGSLLLQRHLNDGLTGENLVPVRDLTTDALSRTLCLELLIILEPSCQALCASSCFSSNRVKNRLCCWINLCPLNKWACSQKRTVFFSINL